MAKPFMHVQEIAQQYTEQALKALASIMTDPNVPPSVRAKAATEVLNRSQGVLPDDCQKFIPDNRVYYVYSVHEKNGRLIYIGKGCGRRGHQSAQRLSGKYRIRAKFTSEKQALLFERRLIERFRPHHNSVYNRAA